MVDLPMYFASQALARYNEQRDEEAMRLVDHALRLEPSLAFANYLKGIIAVARGDFETGLPLQEWRYRCPGTQAFVAPYRSRQQWDGKPTLAKVLLWPEQGYGDAIQMLRFLPIVAERCPRVTLEIQPALLDLANQVHANVFASGEHYPDFDVHCSLASLPYVLGVRPETIPSGPYLRARPAENAYGLRIGVCWSRDTDTPTRRHRNMAALDMEPLAKEFDLLSLQHEDNTWRSFEETAALLAGLDLVITVDSAIGHLAGALGVPVWIMLSVNCDQRWMRRCSDTPWYECARLFRQRVQGDWSNVVREIVAALRERDARTTVMAPRQGATPGRRAGPDIGPVSFVVSADQV